MVGPMQCTKHAFEGGISLSGGVPRLSAVHLHVPNTRGESGTDSICPGVTLFQAFGKKWVQSAWTEGCELRIVAGVHRVDHSASNLTSIRRSPELRAVAGGLSHLRDHRSEEVLMLPWTPLPSQQAAEGWESLQRKPGTCLLSQRCVQFLLSFSFSHSQNSRLH